jgi:hypothetical protein
MDQRVTLVPRTLQNTVHKGIGMFSRTGLAALLLLLALPARAQDQPAATTAPTPVSDAPAASIGYTRDTPVEKIAADPAAAAVLNKDLPGLLTDAQYPLFKGMSLKQLQAASGGDLSREDVDKAVADLQALFPH